MPTLYLSFASANGFLGACVIDAEDFIAAVRKTWMLGINPGGEVACFDMTAVEDSPFPKNVLMDRETIEFFDSGRPSSKLEDLSDMELAVAKRDMRMHMICEEHNK